MTTYYVDDGGSQTAPYDTYAKAETTLAALIAAVGGFTADDEIHAGHDHAEDTAATVELALANGVGSQPVRPISTNTTTDDYQAGASITVSGAGNDLNLSTGASAWYGFTFVVADNINFVTANSVHRFHACTFTIADRPIVIGAGGITLLYDDCAIVSTDAGGPSFNIAADGLNLLIRGGSITMGNANSAGPILEFGAGDNNNEVLIEDCDLSGCTSDMSLVSFGASNNNRVTYRRCKLPSAFTIPAVTREGNRIEIESCSGGTSNEAFLGIGGVDGGNGMWRTNRGDIRTATTQKRVGGAKDYPDGGSGNDYSWELTTSANVSYFAPLESPPLGYIARPGAQTVTIHTADNNDLNDNELFSKVEHPSTDIPANPNHVVLQNTKPDPLATPSAVARDAGSVWDGAGTGVDGGEGQQKLASDSFNPTEAGPVITRVYCAKPNTTMYVDAKPEVTRL